MKKTIYDISLPSGRKELNVEKILAAVGRAPALDSLGLDKAGVELKNGFINVNRRLETNVPGIYAVGDCTGLLMLAHAAMAMGEIAAENAMQGCREFDAACCPVCAFVGPEIAGIGYTEEKARELGIACRLGRFPMAANGRSLVLGETDGMIKVLIGEEFGEIIGVHILAPRATDLIEEAALAMQLECTAEELINTIHCHPTVSEALREGTMAAMNRAIHIPNRA